MGLTVTSSSLPAVPLTAAPLPRALRGTAISSALDNQRGAAVPQPHTVALGDILR